MFDQNGRNVECGMVSRYNNEAPYRVRNLCQVILKRITFGVLIVADKKFPGPWKEEHLRRSTEMLKEGLLKAFTVEVAGVERAPGGFVGTLNGQDMGKVVLEFRETK